MPSVFVYTATCPHCGSMVAACTNRVPKADLAEEVADWIADELIVGRIDGNNRVTLKKHAANCPFTLEVRS